ncbi:MAG: hypothetical protein RL696_20 [Actinomycetota bacterium]|jgi:hypothetical protein
MESLAALVAGIFVGIIALALADIVTAIQYRRGKLKLWIAVVVNSIVGFVAIWGLSVFWTLAVPPLIGLVISSIILTWPKKKRAA